MDRVTSRDTLPQESTLVNYESSLKPSGFNASLEHEFLIRLAPIYLACRWRVMGHLLRGRQWPRPHLENDLLGMLDYSYEMRLVCREMKDESGGPL